MKTDDQSVAELLELSYRRAMTGDLDGASAALTQARGLGPMRQGSAESMEVMLLEGVIHTYRGQLDAARDRLRRVIALGALVPDSDAPLEACGWLSLVDYNLDNDDAATESLAKACESPHRARPRRVLRASVSAATLCESVGLTAAAASWVSAARLAAPRCGVPALLGLVVFALASVRVSRAALLHLRTPTSREDARSLMLQAQSSINYDAARGMRSKADAHELMVAMVLRLSGREQEALVKLDRLRASGSGLQSLEKTTVRMEAIACRLATEPGYFEPDDIAFLTRYQETVTEPGERADALFMMAALGKRQGSDMQDNWRRQAEESLVAYETRASSLADQIRARGLAAVPPAWLANDTRPA